MRYGVAAEDAGTVGKMVRRSLVLGLLLAPVAAGSVLLVVTQARGTRYAETARRAVPEVIEEAKSGGRVWTSVEMKLSELEMAVLETRDYVYRTYDDGAGKPVDLCIVFSEDNRKGTHPPDVCLEGGGSRIMARYERRVMMDGVEVPLREIVTSQWGQKNYFAYFYKCGDSFTASFYEQQGRIIWLGLRGEDASGALVRLSTPMKEGMDVEAARRRVDELLGGVFGDIRTKLNGEKR